MLRSISTYQIIFGGNFFVLPPTNCWLIWDKINGKSDYADCEMAWTNLPKAVRLKRFLWNGCMRRERDIPREHPTQKPIEIMTWCLSHLPEGVKTILDPFMGSGSTGVAAVKLGYQFIGIDREPKYFDVARRRIVQALREPNLVIDKPIIQKPAFFESKKPRRSKNRHV